MIPIATARRLRAQAPIVLSLLLVPTFLASAASSQPITVRYQEGTQRGFLVLRNEAGDALASGELIKIVHGDRVTARLLFRFHDGSVDDETAVYTQHSTFRLISDRHVQKGPSFSHDIDFLIDVPSGQVTFRSTDAHGKESSDQSHIDLPPDLANGIIVPILMNLRPSPTPVSVSFLAPLAKPRLIHLLISVAGHEPFTIGGLRFSATNFIVKPVLGGIAGIVAPMIGKEPAPAHLWVLDGRAPAFVREEGQFFEDGPIWSIEQVSPHESALPSKVAAR